MFKKSSLISILSITSVEKSENIEPEEDNILDVNEYKYPSLKKLKSTVNDKKNPYRDLDVRTKDIFEDFHQRIRNAPKTVLQKIEESKGGIEFQLKQSEKQLGDLLQFGEQLITNIRVANEKREYEIRVADALPIPEIKQRIDNESTLLISTIEDIASKWFELNQINEPMELYENLNEQKERISDVLSTKNAIIERCQKEIERMNQVYDEETERQTNDIKLLVERSSIQIELMREAYDAHLQLFENVLEEDRVRLFEDYVKKLAESYDQFVASDEKKTNFAKKQFEFYKKELERVAIEQNEITKAMYIRLEKDAEALQLEMRFAQNNALLNSEKMDYNYQILHKRLEEHSIVNNQQKRRIGRIKESNLALNKRIARTIEENNLKEQNLQDQLKKLHITISELESKFKTFKLLNKKKFDKLWEINFKEIKGLILSVLDIDKILTEQHLAQPWNFPTINLDDINPLKKKVVNTYFQQFDIMNPFPKKKNQKKQKFLTFNEREENEAEMRLLRNLFRRLSDRTEFLLENHLKKILKPFSAEQHRFIQITNVFIALHITDNTMINLLMKFLRPYTFCPNCQNDLPDSIKERLYLIKPNIEDISNQETFSSLKSDKCKNHHLIMDSAFVLTALNDFVAYKMKKAEEMNENLMITPDKNTINISNEKIELFFNKFLQYLSDEKLKVWKTMDHGLKHFILVLQKRKKLHNDCIFLRKQNMEFKFLLQKIYAEKKNS